MFFIFLSIWLGMFFLSLYWLMSFGDEPTTPDMSVGQRLRRRLHRHDDFMFDVGDIVELEWRFARVLAEAKGCNARN